MRHHFKSGGQTANNRCPICNKPQNKPADLSTGGSEALHQSCQGSSRRQPLSRRWRFSPARFSCTRILMAKQLVHKKRIGRPPGKKYSETIPARLEPDTLANLDRWAAANDVSRSEAIRRLVELGLKAKGKS